MVGVGEDIVGVGEGCSGSSLWGEKLVGMGGRGGGLVVNIEGTK